jgi:hypothetical protein
MTAPKKLTEAGTARKRAPGAGRPALGKVKLTCHIAPETRAKLGDRPGEAIDRAFSETNSQDGEREPSPH